MTEQAEIPPLVIVEGFLGGASAALWGSFEDCLNCSAHRSPRRTIHVNVGPVSSLHDRACELFYALRGGTVDYGEQHASFYKHSRHGRTHSQGLYPEWSKQFPLHFLGHSMGGATIMKLQHLIKMDYFPYAHPDMIRSVTAVSSPFRGTQLVYPLGECTDSAPNLRPYSIGSLMSLSVHTLAYLGPLLPPSFDVHAESRSLSFQQSSFLSFLKQLWKSDWAHSKDAAPYDLTLQSADERESAEEGYLHHKTFYRSHVTVMTKRASTNNPLHKPLLNQLTSPLLYIAAKLIGSFDFAMLRPLPSFLSVIALTDKSRISVDTETQLGEEYWANDGVVPLFSQWHPHPCRSTKCFHVSSDKSPPPKPGVWFVHRLDDAFHNSIMPVWTNSTRQQLFWKDLGAWLNEIDAACAMRGWHSQHDDNVWNKPLAIEK